MSVHSPRFFADSDEAFDYWRGPSDSFLGGPHWYSINRMLEDAESLKNGLPNIVPMINDDDDELVEVWSAVNQIVRIGEKIRECENYAEFLKLAKLLVTEVDLHPSIDMTRDEDELNFCYDCKLISYTLGEIDTDNDETDAVCPRCGSQAYVIASDEEIEKYGQLLGRSYC